MHVGQKVVCIKAGPIILIPGVLHPPLILGAIYTILGIRNCPCGNVVVDVGLSSEYQTLEMCSKCGRIEQPTPIWWVGAKRFAPVEEKTDSIFIEQFLPIEKIAA
jgi:hypothetical protein